MVCGQHQVVLIIPQCWSLKILHPQSTSVSNSFWYEVLIIFSQAASTKSRKYQVRRDVADSDSIGYLEVFHNHSWYSVCADRISVNIANVICTQMGFDGAIAFGDIGMKITVPYEEQLKLSNLTCSGVERTIGECNHTSHWETGPCYGRRIASLMCRGRKL